MDDDHIVWIACEVLALILRPVVAVQHPRRGVAEVQIPHVVRITRVVFHVKLDLAQWLIVARRDWLGCIAIPCERLGIHILSVADQSLQTAHVAVGVLVSAVEGLA